VGPSGSGKTFVAQRLARALNLAYICNDAIIWRAQWTPTPRPQRFDEFERATGAPEWAYDGNVGSLNDGEDMLILQRADTLVWLDLPKLDVMRQLFVRTVRRAWHREVLWHENTENFRTSFTSRESILWWSWRTHALRRRQYTAAFVDPRLAHLIKVRLRSRAAVDRRLRVIISQKCK
jgi:adenylate kinase family enzyme